MSLIPRWTFGEVELTDYPYSVQFGADHGLPETTTTVLTSFMTAGEIEATSSPSNRTIVLPILIEGSDMLDLARNLAALEAECRRPMNELTFEPGDGFGPASKFSTFETGSLVWNRDDDQESALLRSYTLTIRALSYAYSANETIVPALAPPPSTPTTAGIDDCSSLTGWSSPTELAAFTVGAGSGGGGDQEIRAQSNPIAGTPSRADFTLVRSGTVTWGSTRYLSFDYFYGTNYGYAGVTETAAFIVAGGVRIELDQLAQVAAPAPFGAYVRATFVVPSSVVTSTSIQFMARTTALRDSVRTIHLTQVTQSDQPPFSGTARQQTRTFAVGGSAPTVGSVALSSEASALGDGTIVFTYEANETVASGYSPPCSPWRVSGPARNPDAGAVSGSSVVISSNETYEIPFTALPPGVYQVAARLKASAAGTYEIGVTYAQKLGGVQQRTEYVPHMVAVGTSYQVVTLGIRDLPDIPAAATPSSVQVIGVGYAPGTVTLDEVWLFNMTLGRLTQVDLGTGTPVAGGPSKRLWIDSPTLANGGLGGLFRGVAADRSDAISAFPNASAPGVHEFKPGVNKLFTVTPNTATSVASFRYFMAWLHTAAE